MFNVWRNKKSRRKLILRLNLYSVPLSAFSLTALSVRDIAENTRRLESVIDNLREVAESQHRSMSNLIELIIRQYIDAHKKTEE